jgi:hypothetical protein
MKRLLTVLSLVSSILLTTAASAESSLSITAKNHAGEVFSRTYTAEDLLALEQTVVVTKNDYVDNETTFVGPRLSTLLKEFDLAEGDEIFVTALNDYRTVIPAAEALNYDVIVAVLMNGEPMNIRDKGPFWVIYPMSDHPELREPVFNDRLIWQLASINLEHAS